MQQKQRYPLSTGIILPIISHSFPNQIVYQQENLPDKKHHSSTMTISISNII